VRLQAGEAAFWRDPADKDKAPAPLKGAFEGALISMKPYVDAVA
jgi:hypothetical protein